MEFTQEWISVKDKLPDQAGNYLVNVHEWSERDERWYNMVLDAWYNPTPPIFGNGDIGWCLMNEFYQFSDNMRDKITHWTNWPHPPTFDEDEEPPETSNLYF